MQGKILVGDPLGTDGTRKIGYEKKLFREAGKNRPLTARRVFSS